MPHACLRRDFFPQRQQAAIDEYHLVVGVVDDERELVGVETKIERVEHATHERDAEVRLEMLIVVPAERGNAVLGADAQALEPACQPARAVGEVGVRVPMERPVRPACDDGAAREDPLGATQDCRQREREVHHQAVHAAGL